MTIDLRQRINTFKGSVDIRLPTNSTCYSIEKGWVLRHETRCQSKELGKSIMRLRGLGWLVWSSFMGCWTPLLIPKKVWWSKNVLNITTLTICFGVWFQCTKKLNLKIYNPSQKQKAMSPYKFYINLELVLGSMPLVYWAHWNVEMVTHVMIQWI